MHMRRKGTTAGKIWSVVTTLLIVLVGLLAVLLAGVRLVGYTPYAVLSGSMTPAYQVGDLVYVKAIDPEEIEVGDAITFVYDESLTVVTHRVTAVDRENGSFTTKGDANDSEDGRAVLYENVLGVVQFSLPKLGYVSSYLTSAQGRYAALLVVCAILLAMILPELFGREKPPAGEPEKPPRSEDGHESE